MSEEKHPKKHPKKAIIKISGSSTSVFKVSKDVELVKVKPKRGG